MVRGAKSTYFYPAGHSHGCCSRRAVHVQTAGDVAAACAAAAQALCAPRTLPERLTFKALYRQSLEGICCLHMRQRPYDLK